SSSRPTRAVNADPRNASNRLATPLVRSTCHAGTGPAMPFTSTAPRLWYSNRLPTSPRVAAAMTTTSGSASAFSRAARFGLSPTTDRLLLRGAFADQITHDDQPGSDPDARLQSDRFDIEAADSVD